MSAAGQFLRRCKANFAQHGIRLEPQIVEYMSFLLLLRDRWEEIINLRQPEEIRRLINTADNELHETYPNLSIPSQLPLERFGPDGVMTLIGILRGALDASPYVNGPDDNDLGDFFQREIRSELLKSTSGSQYPTPYHIAELMASLASIQPDANILDPAMGSAGLLIAALRDAPQATLYGGDFDPIWAGIGSANLILHDKGNSTVHVGSTFANYEVWQEEFDTVLMNPPFGDGLGVQEVFETVGEEFGRNNATVFGAFALQALRHGGRAVFLTPSGTLFADRGAEANLKKALFTESLEAIITLPKRSFHPHSNVEAHLVIVKKPSERDQPTTNPIWFCEIERDGYPEGSERDLTAPKDPQDNELARARELIVTTRHPDAWETHFERNEICTIQTIFLQPDYGLTGLGVRVADDHTLPNWNISSTPTSSLIKIYGQENQLQAWIAQTYKDRAIIALTIEQEIACIWTEILSRDDWEEGLITEWHNELADSHLQVQFDDQQELVLRQARTTYEFSSSDEHPEIACLINESGRLVTPWLTINMPQKVQEREFGDRFAAIQLQNAREEQIGWLIDWTESQNERDEDAEDEDAPQTVQMLIVFQDQINLFERDNSVFGFVANGCFEVDRESGRFIVEQGQAVQLREDVALAGFAIGPAPWTKQGFRMFGALIRRDDFSPIDNLHPRRFLPEPEKVPIEHPAKVIADIRKNQTQFNAHVDSLLSMLGGVSRHEEQSDQYFPVPEWLIGMLDKQQKSLYLLIVAKHLGDGRPVHFNTKDVLVWKEEGNSEITFSDADIAMQLDLFCRMGLLVKVHSEGDNLYRCLTHGDVTKQQVQNPEGTHEAN